MALIMHKKSGRQSFDILLIALCILIRTSYLYADNNSLVHKECVDHKYREYVNVLNRLRMDKSSPNSILTAKDELLSKFSSRTDESKNEAFRAFWKFYNETIRVLDSSFSSKPDYQKLLFKIAEATGLYYDPFPAFDKLNNDAARDIKNNYAQILEELYVYRKAGMNFGSSEGTWYLKDDMDFLFDASSITIGDYKEYVRFYAEEWRKDIVDDGALLISWDDFRKRIVRWEQFAELPPIVVPLAIRDSDRSLTTLAA